MAMIGATLQYGTISRNTLAWVAACGWDDDAVWCEISSNCDTLTTEELQAAVYSLKVCDFAVDLEADPPEEIPRSCVTWQADNSVLVIVDDPVGTTTIYRCLDFDTGFEVVA